MSERWDIAGKRVVLTGATNGIGLAVARALVAAGARLAIVARNAERAELARAAINKAGGATVDVLLADLSSQGEIWRLAAEIADRYPRLDVLANNAGATYGSRRQSVDGIELTWAVNHLAPFLLTTLLVERLKSSAPARIITTASDAHLGARIPFDDLDARRRYRSFRRYGETKLANILFTTELARRLAGTGVTANCYHPGLVATGFNRNNGVLMDAAMRVVGLFARSPEKGAETLVWLATSSDVEDVTGGYFVDKRLAKPSAAAQDAVTARQLWEVSERQVAGAQSSAGPWPPERAADAAT